MAAALLGESIKCRLWQAGKDLGEGMLLISEDFLQWKASRGEEEIKYSYPEVSVHAISRDFDVFPHECLYILVIQEDTPAAVAEVGDGHEVEDDEEDDMREASDGGTSLELRIVPEDTAKLSELYSVICYCQGLHPDPDLSEDDEEEIDDHLVAAMFGQQPSGAGELVEEEENMEETPEGDGQFDDAD